MEYRKIQLTGESTYIVSLPKTWVTRNRLEKGDVVYVMEKGDEIVLKLKEEKEKDAQIKIKSNDLEFLSRLLITKYIQGYDTIVFSAKDHLDHKVRESLIQVSSYLIGLEPFGEAKDSITFRMLMKGGRNVMESVERMHDMSILSLRELIDYVDCGKENESILDGIIQRDNEIDKFYFLILRQLVSADGFEAMILGQVAKSIERISDHVEAIASLLKEGKRMKPEDFKLYKQVVDLYGDVMHTLKNRDMSSAEEILLKIQKFRVAERRVISGLDVEGAENILVYASFRRIGEYISDIAESVINLS
jgi:phosphate uptake regulator